MELKQPSRLLLNNKREDLPTKEIKEKVAPTTATQASVITKAEVDVMKEKEDTSYQTLQPSAPIPTDKRLIQPTRIPTTRRTLVQSKLKANNNTTTSKTVVA